MASESWVAVSGCRGSAYPRFGELAFKMLIVKQRMTLSSSGLVGKGKRPLTLGLKRILEQMQGMTLSRSWNGEFHGKPVRQEI